MGTPGEAHGKIKDVRGKWGFIRDSKCPSYDLFFHMSEVNEDQREGLAKGASVKYTIQQDPWRNERKSKFKAIGVSRLKSNNSSTNGSSSSSSSSSGNVLDKKKKKKKKSKRKDFLQSFLEVSSDTGSKVDSNTSGQAKSEKVPTKVPAKVMAKSKSSNWRLDMKAPLVDKTATPTLNFEDQRKGASPSTVSLETSDTDSPRITRP